MAGTNKLTPDHLKSIGIELATPSSSSTASKAPSSPKAAKAPSSPAAKVASSPKAAKASKAPIAKTDGAPVVAPKELTPGELSTLSKEERGAYHAARRAAAQAQAPAEPKQQVSKADRRAQQEAARAMKESKKDAGKDDEETIAEMKLAGLSDEQARIMFAEMNKTVVEGDDEEEDDDDSLIGSVQRWMTEQGNDATTGDSIRDFNMKVRFQGHVDSTPPDHLKCILEIIVGNVFKGSDIATSKPQPQLMAKKISPFVKQWAAIVDSLYNKVGDVLAAADIIVSTIHSIVDTVAAEAPLAARECAVVGFVMTMREELDTMEDEELLPACRHLGAGGRVMEKFIEFLEEEVGGSDDESED